MSPPSPDRPPIRRRKVFEHDWELVEPPAGSPGGSYTRCRRCGVVYEQRSGEGCPKKESA